MRGMAMDGNVGGGGLVERFDGSANPEVVVQVNKKTNKTNLMVVYS